MTKTLILLADVPEQGTAHFNPNFDGFDQHDYLCREDLAVWIEKHMANQEFVEVDTIEVEGIDYLAFWGSKPDPMVEIAL